MTNDMTTNEQAGGESRDLDLSQFEGMTPEEHSLPREMQELFLEQQEAKDASALREELDTVRMLGNEARIEANALIAEVKRLREENAGLKRKLRTAMQTIDELNQAYIDQNI